MVKGTSNVELVAASTTHFEHKSQDVDVVGLHQDIRDIERLVADFIACVVTCYSFVVVRSVDGVATAQIVLDSTLVL